MAPNPPSVSPLDRIFPLRFPLADDAVARCDGRMTTLQKATSRPSGGGTDSIATTACAPGERSAQADRRRTPRCADVPVKSHAFQAVFLPELPRVSEMRRATATFLRRSVWTVPLADDVVLAVSELVTNAIRHGDGEVKLRVSVANGEVRVTVTDGSPERAVLRQADADDESGRGLALVAAFAHRWGSRGRETWCTFRYPQEAGTVGA